MTVSALMAPTDSSRSVFYQYFSEVHEVMDMRRRERAALEALVTRHCEGVVARTGFVAVPRELGVRPTTLQRLTTTLADTVDGGTVDSGSDEDGDAGDPDAGSDAGVSDAGLNDAGSVDAGSADGGISFPFVPSTFDLAMLPAADAAVTVGIYCHK